MNPNAVKFPDFVGNAAGLLDHGVKQPARRLHAALALGLQLLVKLLFIAGDALVCKLAGSRGRSGSRTQA